MNVWRYCLVLLLSLALIAVVLYFFKNPVPEPHVSEAGTLFLPEGVAHYEITGRAYYAVHILLLLPLVYAVLSGYRQRVKIPGLAETFKRDFIRWFVLFAGGAAGYAVLKLLPYTGIMAGYGHYPADQNDSFFYEPRYLPVIIMVFSIVTVVLLLRYLFRGHRVMLSWDWEGSRLFLLTGFCFIYIICMIIRVAGAGYIELTPVIIPVLLWPLFSGGRSTWYRVADILLFLAGLSAGFVYLFVFTGMFNPDIWWYLLNASVYGLLGYGIALLVPAVLSFYIMAFSLARHSAIPSEKVNFPAGYGGHHQPFWGL